MEKDNMWVRVLFDVYKYLPKAVQACKETAYGLADSGFAYQGNTYDLIQKIIDCNARCEAYINAKVLVDQALQALDSKYAAILRLKATTRLSLEQISEKTGFALRSTFRWYNEGIAKAAAFLRRSGYDDEWLKQRYEGDILFDKMREQMRGCNEYVSREDRLALNIKDAVSAGFLLPGTRVANIGCSD